MSHSAVLVFTARSPKKILEQGGSQAWVLDRNRARGYEYLICAQNTHTTWGDATEPHGSAFLVGRISDLVPAPDDQERWLIRISEYARVNIPNAWQGWRNPVRYTTLEDLGLDPSKLNFEPAPEVPEERIEQSVTHPARPTGAVRPLTIAEAKQGLAAQFGVGIDDIEIIIRG
ncbi:hypothetical protein NR798_36800 [Archangium gephyra]|uniref:hypothetical protein n=1 Tax=Archangium gephyra TaxID=48 RepID=UPI0035D402C4